MAKSPKARARRRERDGGDDGPGAWTRARPPDHVTISRSLVPRHRDPFLRIELGPRKPARRRR